MKKIITLTIGILLFLNGLLAAQSDYSFVKKTHSFRGEGNETLYLDHYSAKEKISNQPTPCIIFVFGGAFARGSRDVPKYMPYFDYLVKNGYTVVSIDYRLGLKEASQQQGLSQEEFAGHFINAVDMAVEDLFDATNFVLEHASEWNIDKKQIIANGSSAGAVTVLQAEHAICNGTYNVLNKLPAGFNYAGIIAFAGGIFLPEGDIYWQNHPCPIMMFHGDADLQVPFDRLTYANMGLYGAKSIAETLDSNNYPYYFYQFENYGHEIASDPMQDNKEDVLWFLHTFVRDKKAYQVVKEQKEIGRPEVKKDFGFDDYVRGNFDR
ncbi:MAG: alpha/beta hydrolase [Candidatus Azobacteroides sp.]|nr:alpha/beta hydrolase [Candidatus Azobacteroides sp.]